MKKVGLDTSILSSFYRCNVERILTSCITARFCSSTVAEKQMLQRVVRSTQRTISDVYTSHCRDRANRNMRDSTHPAYGLLSSLPSGRRLCCIWVRTSRLKNSFFPDAVRLINAMSCIELYCTLSCCTYLVCSALLLC